MAAILGRDAFLAGIDDLLPSLRERAARVERAGRLADETVAMLAAAGVFGAMQPARWGGLELDPASFFEGVARIAGACPSTGWVSCVLGVHGWQLALFPERAQAEVWEGTPDARASSSYAPTGTVRVADGGYRLSGTWNFSSGVDFCGWALLGGVIPDQGEGPEFRVFLVPATDVAIDHDSWQVSGLQGTGSKDVTLADAFVPAYRTLSIVDDHAGTHPGRAVNPGPLYALPWMSIFAYGIAAPAIGAATGALEHFTAQARLRVSPRGGPPAALNPALHMALANAHATVADARNRQHQTWRDMYATAQGNRPIALESRAMCRYEAARSIVGCLHAVLDVFGYGGGGVMRLDNPIQRYLRDLLAMRNHPCAIPEPRATVYAKAAMGLAQDPFTMASPAGLV